MDKKEISEIFDQLESGYDQMAGKFSETRKFFWRDLEFIADYIENDDKILDYGCGNGRLLEILNDKKIDYTGIDISGKLINLAKQKYKGKNIKFIKITGSDSLSPTKFRKATTVKKGYINNKLSQDSNNKDLVGDESFPDNYFNVVVSIAVFHHFPIDYAEKMAKELFRITKPGGKIIVTVWNLKQERFKKNIKKDSKDMIIPFKNNDGKIFNRYHWIYTKKDLEEIFSKAGFKIEKSGLVEGKNILLIGKK